MVSASFYRRVLVTTEPLADVVGGQRVTTATRVL
jgi:hypothetical protein